MLDSRAIPVLVIVAGMSIASAATPATSGRVTVRERPARIVFAVWAHRGPRLYASNGDGTEATHIRTRSTAAYPDLSPDGSEIVYQAGVGTGPIVVMRRDGTSAHVIAPIGQSAKWSADGKRIAFLAPGAGIYVVAPDGSHRRLVVKSRAAIISGWLPDGEIAYVCRFGPPGVCAVSSDGRHRRVAGVIGSIPFATYSPDGTLAAYVGAEGRMFVMNADGSDRRLLYSGIAGKNTDCGLAWAPDGKHIAFSPIQAGPLYTIDITTRKATRLDGTPGGACGASWR